MRSDPGDDMQPHSAGHTKTIAIIARNLDIWSYRAIGQSPPGEEGLDDSENVPATQG